MLETIILSTNLPRTQSFMKLPKSIIEAFTLIKTMASSSTRSKGASQERLWDNRFDLPRGAVEIIYIARKNHFDYDNIMFTLEYRFPDEKDLGILPNEKAVKKLWRRIKTADANKHKDFEEREICMKRKGDNALVREDRAKTQTLLQAVGVGLESEVSDQTYKKGPIVYAEAELEDASENEES
ncbi:MAG: hypothetical protein MMC33_002557 [Icmadophila ericetorum]|nr:hypothetical protein [Icmadophila ericetorum]